MVVFIIIFILRFRLIRKVAFQPCFLKALWNYVNTEKRILSFSSPVYSATVLSMLSSGVVITPVEADRIVPALTMFCFFLKNHISLLSDELLYEGLYLFFIYVYLKIAWLIYVINVFTEMNYICLFIMGVEVNPSFWVLMLTQAWGC